MPDSTWKLNLFLSINVHSVILLWFYLSPAAALCGFTWEFLASALMDEHKKILLQNTTVGYLCEISWFKLFL